MTRHQGFDVRVAPEVEDALRRSESSGTSLRGRFLVEAERLALRAIERQVRTWENELKDRG